MSILILGYGKTGRAVDDYLMKSLTSEDVMIYDDILPSGYGNSGSSRGATSGERLFFDRPRREELIEKHLCGVSRCVTSPGIERGHEVIKALLAAGIPVTSEIEFAYSELMKKKDEKKITAITGTNGKTTATTLCESAVRTAGLEGKTFTGGNLGVPFIAGVADYNNFILEISSFQLEWIYDFKPDIAVLLNVRDDHMDRYVNFDEYRLTKYKLFKNLRYSDLAVLNQEDSNSAILKGVAGSRTVLFGFNERKCDVYFKDDSINLKLKDITGFNAVVPLDKAPDKRKFVIEDMMAAAAAMILSGISPEAVAEAFCGYRLLKHRVEHVGSVGRIKFYDDSKATNPAAVISALESFVPGVSGEGPVSESMPDIVLILGGKDKGFSYESLALPISRSVLACVLIGETKEAMAESLKKYSELIFADDMQDAVDKAYGRLAGNRRSGSAALSSAEKEGIVLLSPSTSSFDMFRDYGERGDVFKECFMKLSRVHKND